MENDDLKYKVTRFARDKNDDLKYKVTRFARDNKVLISIKYMYHLLEVPVSLKRLVDNSFY